MKNVFVIEVRFELSAEEAREEVAQALALASVKVANGRYPLVSDDGEYPWGPIRNVKDEIIGRWEVVPTRGE